MCVQSAFGRNHLRSLLNGVILLCLVAITGCQRVSADGFSTNGAFHALPATSAGFKKGDESDAGALVSALEEVVRRSPPINYADLNSEEKRDRFYKTEKHKLFGPTNTYDFLLACIDQKSSLLTYSESDKNFQINMYTDSPNSRENAQEVYEALAESIRALRQADMMRLSGVRDHEPPVSADDTLTRLDPQIFQAGQIRLPAGIGIAIVNNPFLEEEVVTRGAAAAAELQDAELNLRQTKNQKFGLNIKIEDFTAHAARWRNWPYSLAAAPWFAMVPYGGNPSDVCLIGKFRDVDLTDGGSSIVPFVNSKVDKLSGEIMSWYLVDRKSLKIISKADF